ncbi:hypothetical protein QR680_015541 [Steinernema hermaphroditum]|uniref:G-protein coupled receptors family 1 profile domain-containing protein n=1 Tax=Steinernema hermaphroditum TaxID=289476 RepID=A0AA39HAB3_9BILA|nr:hypothetical protein QR680_015541 [Steinernema hermaphroditum]
MLLCFLATVDLACLIYNVVNGVWILIGITLQKPDCFKIVIIYCCTQFVSNSVVLSIALDRLIAVTFPTRYMRLSLLFTIIVAALPGLLTGGVFAVLGTVSLTNDSRKLRGCLVGETTLKGHEKAMKSITAFLIVFVGTYFISRAGIELLWNDGNNTADVKLLWNDGNAAKDGNFFKKTMVRRV